MAKRINKKKRRQRIAILIVACLVILALFVTLVMFVFKAFKKEKTVEVVEEEKSTMLMATSVEEYQQYNVNELGQIPVMMYHGIDATVSSADTGNTGGNIDYDGYQRTAEAFIQDLEMYYQRGYRMVRLTDYVDGKIKVEAGKSPIVLTFDDGLANNAFVTGVDENGEIIIDPNSAVGILESFKEKYPDFNVTATFFVSYGLFRQEQYNTQIVQWLVKHGYDIGNHTYTHCDFTEIDSANANDEVGVIYDLLDQIIPGEYVNIVALPFGSPYSFDHPNMPSILNPTYHGKSYTTKCTLQVGWEQDYSPFDVNFNPQFVKRIRAYDCDGTNFDITYAFNLLDTTHYVSDGREDTVVFPSNYQEMLGNTYNLEVISY